MKYAVVERERRFLPGQTVDLSRASRVIEIEDRYLTEFTGYALAGTDAEQAARLLAAYGCSS